MNLKGPRPTTPTLRRWARRLAASLAGRRTFAIAALLGAATLVSVPDAQAQRAFARRFPAPAAQPVTVKGDIRLIGNHTLGCDTADATCRNVLAGTTTGRNNDFLPVAVNVDPDGGNNINSSSATLTLPAGATVRFAGLYWGADNTNTAARTTVRLRAPGQGYVTRTASVVDTIVGQNGYQSFSDITSVVASAGSGVYTVANVAQTVGGTTTGHWGGWTIVVAYQDPNGTLRNLSVFDGFIYGNGTPAYQDINISGFYTPISGTVNTNLGLVVYDGDRGQSDGGNSLEFGPNTGALSPVSDAANPVNDVWNSSISFEGVPVTAGRTPASVNLLGVDIDNIKPATPLPYGSSAAVLRVRSTSGDVNYPGVVTLATDAFEPEIVTSFTKTAVDDNGGAFRPGDIVTYTISLTNRGNDNSVETVITDPLPAGVTYVPGSLQIASGANAGAKTDAAGDDQANYDVATRTVTFRVGIGADGTNGGTVAPGAGATLSFKARIDPAASHGSNLSNVADVDFVSGTSRTPGHGSTPPSTFTVTGEADLSITKTGPATVPAGNAIRYVLTVANAGPDGANGATVTDNMPAGITGVTIACAASGGASCPNTAGLATLAAVAIPTLPSGGSVVFTIDGTAPSTATSLSNSASVAPPANTVDPSTGDNNASPVVTAVQPADLAVTNTVSAGPYYPGQNVTYTVTVTNNGPGAATSASLTDVLPGTLTFVSMSTPAGWTATTPAVGAGGTITATIASLASGASATFTIVAQIPASTADGTVFSDTASASSATTDPNGANNSATAAFSVTAGADVSLVKTLVTAGPYRQAQSIAYILVVSNAGPVTATNVQVTDTPTNLTITGVSGAGCSALPCTIASLASGASTTINVTATITAAGAFDNAASVTAAEMDPTPGNNGDTTGNGGTADPAADLAITNVLSSTAPAPAGSTVTYTITVSNNGPSAVTGATLAETMPPQLTGVTWTCASGCASTAGAGDINTLIDVPVGGTVTILVTGTAPTTTPSTIAAATATVTTPSGTVDTNAANNTATAPAIAVSALPIAAIDDAGSTGGASGGIAIPNVLGNDTFNGAGAGTGSVTLSVVAPASTPNVALNTATGAVTVAAGTPSGTYSLTYRICETANPTNCDDAVATVTVTSAALVANNDAGTANGQTGGTAVANVLGNDALNGGTPTTANTTLTQLSTTNANLVLDTATGAVNVAPGTPAGTYTLTYRMCETINPSNCADATVAVTVTAAVIDAVDDTAGPVEGSAGATGVIDVLGNDTIGAIAATTSNVTVTPATSGPLTLNADGTVDLAPNTPAGPYTLNYQVCEQLNPANCDTATLTVNVSAAPIVANDDAPPAIVGATGGIAIANVLGNDTLGGATPSLSTVTLGQVSTSNANVTLDASTGAVSVAPSTPAGTYTLVYRVCQQLNPTNCDEATVTVVVSAAVLDAVDDATPAIDGVAGNPAVINVLGNDTLGGGAATTSAATLTQVSASNPSITLDPATGNVGVAPGTPAGTYTLTYRLCEQLNPTNCDTATVTLNVIAPALAAGDDTGSTRQNTAVVVPVLGNDTMAGSAVNPAAVVVTLVTAPTHGTATVNADGTLTYTPATNYSGSDSLVYRMCDVVNPTVCVDATVSLTITANTVEAVDQTMTTPQTGPVVIDVIGATRNGGGAPLDPASVVIVTAPANGTAVVNADGSITYTPNTLFFGTETFSYRVCDRSTPTPVCDVATVTITVAMQAPQLRLTKTVPARNVRVGDLVRYTVVVENTGISPANGATVVDVPPAGFTYVDGSLRVDDADDRFALVGSSPIRVTGVDVPVGGRATLVYLLRVGAGVGHGVHTNRVSATDATGSTVSNTAAADVTVEGDPMVEDSLVLGSVFDDRNGNGVQDDGERGIPGVRIASVDGLLMETDASGRYHLEGVDGGAFARGRNVILKVDIATLPPGTTFTTENPRVRRVTPGLPVRFDFGVRLPADEAAPPLPDADETQAGPGEGTR